MEWLIAEKIILRIINLRIERAVLTWNFLLKGKKCLTLYHFDPGDFKTLLSFFSQIIYGKFLLNFFSCWLGPAVTCTLVQSCNPAITSTCQESILQSPLPVRNQSYNHLYLSGINPTITSICQESILQSRLPVSNQSCNHLYLSGINPAMTSTCQETILQSPLPVRNQSCNHLYLSGINTAITSTCQESILQSPLLPETNPAMTSTCQESILQSPLPVRNQSCNHLYLSRINPAITSTCQESILQSPTRKHSLHTLSLWNNHVQLSSTWNQSCGRLYCVLQSTDRN